MTYTLKKIYIPARFLFFFHIYFLTSISSAMPKILSNDKRNNAKSLILHGKDTATIAERTGVSKLTVNRLRNTLNPHYERPKGGRPRLVPDSEDATLKLKVRSNCIKSAKDGQQYLNGLGYDISYHTALKKMKSVSFHPALKKKKPFLTKKHMKDRLRWAKEHRDWTVEDWKNVIFSDETKINMWESDGAVYTWKEDGQPELPHNFHPTVKHNGGGLMIWSCMTSLGVGYAEAIVEGTMDAKLYTDILGQSYQATLDHYGLNRKKVIFQHDNDPKHTAKHTKKWLKTNWYNTMTDWPSCSPDLNPIENLWHHVKTRLGKYDNKPTNKDQLFDRFTVEWYKFDEKDMEPYYNSMPQRIEAVIKSKGGHTRY